MSSLISRGRRRRGGRLAGSAALERVKGEVVGEGSEDAKGYG
jgi:hypothetical protein